MPEAWDVLKDCEYCPKCGKKGLIRKHHMLTYTIKCPHCGYDASGEDMDIRQSFLTEICKVFKDFLRLTC